MQEVMADFDSKLPGIGVWTAEIYAMFSLGRADVIAPGDLALQEAARILYDLAQTPDRQRTAPDGRGLVALAIGCGAGVVGLLPRGQRTRRDQMTRVLNALRKEPVSGDTRSVVVFVHGYGANGADLLGLADPLGEHLPDTLFVAPDAPEQIPGMPNGFQWFPIPWIDGSSEEEARRGMEMAVEDFNAFLDALMVDEDVLPEQVVLFGFLAGHDDEPACRPTARRPGGRDRRLFGSVCWNPIC